MQGRKSGKGGNEGNLPSEGDEVFLADFSLYAPGRGAGLKLFH